MNEWGFLVRDISAARFTAAPELTALLHIEAPQDARVHAVSLRCQVRIEPQRRSYGPEETAGVRSLFGERERWSTTLKPFQWMQCHTTVQGFTGETDVELAMPCTYDFDVTGSRYLHALDTGEVPITLMFNGTAFLKGDTGFSVQQIPWDSEARYDLPVAVWQEMIALHFPHTGWVRLDHDVLARLGDYRSAHGLISWEETVDRLLAGATTGVRP